MLGTARLLTFAFRAFVLLLLISLLWATIAKPYNQALVSVAGPLLSDKISVKVLGKHIVIAGSESSSPVSIDGYTLHFGLILMVVLVLAAVGIGAVPRISWLLALAMGVFLLHVVGVALLARGVAWISDASSSENSGRLVFSMFAVFWGVLPVAIGGTWCFLYWIPRISHPISKRDTPVVQPRTRF